MKRFHPVVRALGDQVRRPTTKQILAGLLLMVPAGLATMRDGKVIDVKPTTAPIFLAPIEAVVPGAPSDKQTVALASVYARKFKIPTTLALHIHHAAQEAGISPNVAFGLVRAESSFLPTAVSPVGAVGLTQLMPATARWLEPGITRSDLKNPRTNLRIGFKYLKSLIDRYDGNEKLALTAFNRGPGTVDKLLKRGRNPDNGYAQKVTTGKSAKHVALMNKKFKRRHSS
ncbi:MAG TPA: lytic transglycosylase domain-containing protein [Longimicrobiales bacterium]